MIIESKARAGKRPFPGPALAIFGTPAHLAMLFGALLLVMLAPQGRLWAAAGASLAAAGLLYPASFKRLLQPRWVILLGMLPLLHALVGESDTRFLGMLPISLDGLQMGLAMAARAVVILVMVDGFSNSVDISEVAGLLERIGLRGLGFSVGIAFNLLPILRQSSLNAWHSLWMRGGLRRRRRLALRYYFVTVIGNAIQRAEEIALAAEARAFSPEKARPMPIRHGLLDKVVLLLVGVVLAGFLFL